MDDLGGKPIIFGETSMWVHDGSWTTPKRAPACRRDRVERWISAGDAAGWVSYDDFAERTKKHGQRRVFEAPFVTLGNDPRGT